MAFMKRNVNLGLLVLIVASLILFTGFAVYYQTTFKGITEEYNTKLGQTRADSVKDHLVKVYGIEEGRIATETKGQSEPLADENNKSLNRRVDFSITQ